MIQLGHLRKPLPSPHLANLTFPDLTGTILDCEILAPGVDCASLSGTIHRKKGNGGNFTVHLYVFDVLRVDNQDLSKSALGARLLHLAVLEPHLQSECIHFLPWVATKAEKHKLYESVLARGGEGIMLKRLDADYVQGGSTPERFIGRVVEIQGMERLKSGAIRHPRFVSIRSDKRPEDCIWYQGEQ